ncbi:phosphotransferase [Streptomyces sp. NBC_01224]|uniref:phosphotransferase n=1 Tax=Streptomyces sp. NBC_01224 TaxID=2903783 RepID=UPI003FA382DD
MLPARDFHPDNDLFTGTGDGPEVSAVVDWVETSWGPADLDVAHRSTALALLHSVPAGMQFADRCVVRGGALAEDRGPRAPRRRVHALRSPWQPFQRRCTEL